MVHWHYGVGSFNAQDICEAMQEVRAKIGDGVKLAMMMDNAKIHKAHITQELMASPECDI